jgi:hypothetical protein
MTTTVEAIYEGGKLLLPHALSLPEKAHVRVTIESDPDRDAWLTLSEESLTKAWGNANDDVFQALATMARDPQIQRELHAINTEFSAANADGLGKI